MSEPKSPKPAFVEVGFMDLRYSIETALKLRAHLSPKQRAALDIDRITRAIAEQFRLDGMKVYGRPSVEVPITVAPPPVNPWD